MEEMRLIDANEALHMIYDSEKDNPYMRDALLTGAWNCAHVCAVDCINACKTVDAVEVVRCKDCRYWEKFQSSLIGEVMCCIAQGEMNVQKDPYDFCSYGERRSDG